jgi:16S rRNA (adenine1518-N6/adenine1519-N6)-dimethyltransferase
MISKHIHKKNLGQHFLSDPRVQQKIVQACDLKPADTIVEIGPGQGVLTRLMAPLVKKLICVETDRDLIEPLRISMPANVDIVHADFLKWDMSNLTGGIKIVGNIPYYISTPIVEKLIVNRDRIAEAFLTVQLEFGQRLVANPPGKEYGSLSCFVQYYADINMLFKIKNTCFKPAPKVDSCFLKLVMKSRKDGGAVNEEFLFKLIQTAFQQRRKNIVNTLKGLVGKEKLEHSLKSLGIDLNARPENLTLSNYIELSKYLII